MKTQFELEPEDHQHKWERIPFINPKVIDRNPLDMVSNLPGVIQSYLQNTNIKAANDNGYVFNFCVQGEYCDPWTMVFYADLAYSSKDMSSYTNGLILPWFRLPPQHLLINTTIVLHAYYTRTNEEFQDNSTPTCRLIAWHNGKRIVNGGRNVSESENASKALAAAISRTQPTMVDYVDVAPLPKSGGYCLHRQWRLGEGERLAAVADPYSDMMDGEW